MDAYALIANYDIDKLHYEGLDGSGGYGYDVRTHGKYATLATMQD